MHIVCVGSFIEKEVYATYPQIEMPQLSDTWIISKPFPLSELFVLVDKALVAVNQVKN